MKSIFALLSCATAALAASRTSAPSGCITVGSGSSFSTIQAALNSLSTTASGKQCIFIKSGTYKEQVLVSARSAQLTIYGSTTDTTSYAANSVTITGSKSQADGLGNDETATLRVKAVNFKLYNVNVANTYGKGSQALALSAFADSGYYGNSFKGFQDTVLAQSGKQLYAHNHIEGATDFVFGQNSPAWFEKNDIRVVTNSIGYISANGRSSSSGISQFVFNNCDVAAASGNTVKSGTYYLGRPWGEYARVTFQKTSMSEVINPAGWHPWNTGDERTEHVTFAEYGNTGPGASGTRAKFSTKPSSPVAISAVLGSNYASLGFYDADYM
ncbi:pectinesterase [Diaporthe helianthi]|uniref:Pectinesterase n=1 Tax=Diaporthe helianthi TaxID=158607 RepID=A0A2P5HFI1_DIAHE|nr:pectinesterase [Diaporthe helianthi]